MAFNKIIVTEKYKGTPQNIVAQTQRTGTPIIIQPDYQFDVSDMYGIFIPCASIGIGLVWNAVTNLLDAIGGNLNLIGSYAPFITLTPNASTVIWDMHQGYYANLHLTNDVSLFIINASDGFGGTLVITQQYGNNTIEFPSNSKYVNGPITLSLDPCSYDIISVVKDASFFYFVGGTNIDSSGVNTLAQLHDVNLGIKNTGDTLQYDTSTLKWRNLTPYNIENYFYTKNEIDALLDSIVGGTY